MLTPRGEGLWTIDHPLRLLGARLGTRMTVARLDDGRLWLHSAIPIDDALAAELAAIGEVSWIVLPNLFHHLYAEACAARYPDAKIAAPPGIAKKRPKLRVDHVLEGDVAPVGWGETFAQISVRGMPKLEESVFLHRPSRTLLLTDLLFHICEPRGAWTRLLLGLAKATGGPRQSRFLRSTVKDREVFRAGMAKLLSLNFDAIIMAHGEVITAGGKAALREATAWVMSDRAGQRAPARG